jgi:hypothetical protein
MRPELRNRMKKVALILGTITLAIAIWGVYNLYLAKN